MTPKVKVHITPDTNRLRQLVRDHGDLWIANTTAGPHAMPCFNGALGLNITSPDGTHNRNVPMDIIKILGTEE
jgi:hypothetical protein|tara:strand:- start:571 stop:789 length:219 start_codon:yes stop_codon:yes gene_type:complete